MLSDHDTDNMSSVFVRDYMARQMMTDKASDYTEKQNFTVVTATWNVNGQSPPVLLNSCDSPSLRTFDVRPWLSTQFIESAPPDIYAIGFQELDLSKEAFVFYNSPKEEEWRVVLNRTLRRLWPDESYVQIKLVRLVGIMLVIYVRSEHVSHISDVQADMVPTGIMGRLGNKGGVGVSMKFHASTLCFVNSHLAAHTSELERRNQDYWDINSKMTFDNVDTSSLISINTTRTIGIRDHDMVFWIGDLNYRLDSPLVPGGLSNIKSELANCQFASLLANYDQLCREKRNNVIFSDFVEGDIKFPPTYKYDVGTDEFDSSEKRRTPSWTDRVLYKGCDIAQMAYRSHMDLRISDHKPVSAFFRCLVRVVDNDKYNFVYETVMRNLDRMENDFLPQAEVSETDVDFGKVRFLEPRNHIIKLTNVGQVAIQYEFIPTPKLGTRSTPPWLVVNPMSAFLMPGASLDIQLELLVDKTAASEMAICESAILSEILVLHLAGGKDIFVTVKSIYSRSVFGASLTALVRLPQPLATLSDMDYVRLEKCHILDGDSVGDGAPYEIPRELWLLCDSINNRIPTEPKLRDSVFLQQGLRSEFFLIRDWLDSGLPRDVMGLNQKTPISTVSIAEALLLFIDSLRDSVVPSRLTERCLAASSDSGACHDIVADMDSVSRSTFLYITHFLRHLYGGSVPTVIISLFASIMLRSESSANTRSTDVKDNSSTALTKRCRESDKANFLAHFL